MNSFRLSRVTLFSLLLAMLLAIFIWSAGESMRDDCSAYLAGNKSAPSSEYITTGSHTVVISCDNWLPRQTLTVQILCILELVLVVVFIFSLLQDARSSLAMRGRGVVK